MHERLTLADELADAMRDAPDLCAQCGQPLDDDAQYLCDDCTESAYCDGSDICEPWEVRYDPAYQPPDRYGISVFGVLALACLVAVLIGTAGLERVQAQDTTASRTINGHAYTWTLPEPACVLVRGWEDGSSLAWCPDGMARYDPEQGRWYDASETREGGEHADVRDVQALEANGINRNTRRQWVSALVENRGMR